MITERMTDEAFHAELYGHDKAGRHVRAMLLASREAERARRVEQEQAEKIRQLEDMLRLANDKMAEQVRQARWEVATEALERLLRKDMGGAISTRIFLEDVRDANAPKD